MKGEIVNGKEIANKIFKKIKAELNKQKLKPSIAVIVANNDATSHTFVKIKEKKAKELGIDIKKYILPRSISQEEIEKFIQSVKSNFIIVQLPLYKHLNTESILNSINPEKDLDLLSEKAYGTFAETKATKLNKIAMPPVAGAIYEIIKHYKIDVQDKTVLIVGQGRLVGMPSAKLMEMLGAKEILTADKETKSKDLKTMLGKADIVISGVGQEKVINCTKDLKDGVILLDAGSSTQKASSAIVGDIDPKCESKASLFAKVPGGIGPITIAKLFENILKLQNTN